MTHKYITARPTPQDGTRAAGIILGAAMSVRLSRRQFLASAAAPAIAAPQAEFSSKVNVVSLLVTVRDKAGKFVNELSQDDFTVTEDGRPQTISYFSRQYDLPLTLGLLVDTSGSQAEVLADELDASETFFKQVLRDGTDQSFLGSFDGRAYLLQNVTAVRAKLEGALQILYAGLQTRRYVNGTVLYDAIVDSSELIMKKYQGRKALVLLTDGEDTASRTTLEKAVEACQRTDTVVYSVGLGTGLAGGARALEEISNKTGGRYLAVTRKRTVELIYQTVEEELRSQYSLGYVPAPVPDNKAGKPVDKKNPGYHKLHVTVSKPGMTVRTRDGYYAGG
jgi:VWFA-related protein